MVFRVFPARYVLTAAAILMMAGLGQAQQANRRDREPGASNLFPRTGLTLWFQAQMAEAVDGRVARWPDSSGSATDASQEEAARQPLFVKDSANGLPIVRFDGNDDWLGYRLGVDRLSGLTMFVVSSPQAGSEHAAVAWNSEAPLYLTPTREIVAYSFSGTDAAVAPIPATSGFGIASAVKSEGRESLYWNGRLLQATSGKRAYIDLPSQDGAIGAGNGGHFRGDIAEVLVYTRALEDTERAAVEEYLSHKYGIAVEPGMRLPAVNAGTNRPAFTGEPFVLNGAADLPNGYEADWRVEGPAPAAIADRHAPHTVAMFAAPGEYIARLTATDGKAASSDEIRIVATDRDPSDAPVLARAAGTTDQGMIAYWKFDEGSGRNVADASGNGHDARLEPGPTWVAGKAGTSAISFDGIDDRALIPSASFGSQGNMSIAAWVKPSAGIYRGYILDMLRGREHVTLRIEQAGGIANLCFANGNSGILCAPNLTPYLNQWVHVAVTRPAGGAGTKLFINGARVATGTVGADVSGASDWAIGGMFDMPATLAYKGLMDDVRIYRRVLTETEVRSLVDEGNQTGSSGSSADTSAPGVVISSPAANAQVSGAVSVAATATDNVGVARVDFYADGSLKASDSAAPFSYVWDASSASAGDHILKATAFDQAGNSATHQITVKIAAAAQPPVGANSLTIYNGSPSGVLPAGTQSVSLRVNTSQWGFCKFTNIPGSTFANSVPFMYTYGTSHSTDISHIRDGASFRYYIRCRDQAGNISPEYQISFSVGTGSQPQPQPGDTTPPALSGTSPSGTLAAGTQSATLRLNTSEPATCKYSTSAGQSFASMPNTFSTTGGTSHSHTVSGLANGAAYTYYVRCRDAAGNANVFDTPISFAIAAGTVGDTTPPSVSITSPANGATATGVLNVNASATDNVGVVRVELLVDGVVRFTKTAPPFAFAWDTNGIAGGGHTLQARAYDAAGNSAAHQISVNAPLTTGRQFYVSTTGNDSNPGTISQPWRTMLKAVNTMTAGDTTFVRGGVYDKHLSIGFGNASGARNGTASAPITLRAYPGETVIWRNDPSHPVDSIARQGFIDFRQRSYWVIEGFAFENVGPASQISGWWTYGIHVWGPAKGVIIRNNTFDGKGILRTGGMVVDVRYGSDDVVVENNRIVNFPSFSDLMGVMIESNFREVGKEANVVMNRNTVIRGNYMQGIGGDCIQIGEWGGYNTLIENNTCAMTYNDSTNGTSEEFLDIKKSWFTTVRNNIAYGSRPKASSPGGGAMVVHMNAVDVVIEGNTFYDNGQAIGLGSGDRSMFPSWYQGGTALERITIRHNLFYDNNKKTAYNGLAGYGYGIYASGVKGLKIYNNTIAYSADTAVELEANTGVEVYNNVFYRNNYREIWEKSGGGTDWNQVKIGANFFDDQNLGYSITYRKWDNSFVNATPAAFTQATGQGAGSKQGDPMLVNPVTNPSTANYRPRSGSPLIDAGVFILNEVFEFLGARPDMGAFEYGQ